MLGNALKEKYGGIRSVGITGTEQDSAVYMVTRNLSGLVDLVDIG